MSNSVDQRIVEMQFDNAQFEKGVSTTLASLKNLDKGLQLKEGVTGIKNIDSAISKVDFSGMENSLANINDRFSTLGIVGMTAISRITNKLMDMGTAALKAATIDPLTDGLNEYQLKMDAIKTIQANTGLQGEAGIAKITDVLNELNDYADKTIYNFAEMTKNIGTFTAAGVGLDEAAIAIQGIANLAAASGSNSNQASVAMYQLSQALASGTVKLMDWNSVVNAGMGGQLFQRALIDTSRALGTGADEYIAAAGSFRESLKDGWLTSDVLIKTLRNFTMADEALTDQYRETLLQEGYTEEQIARILETAKLANDAATKVKSFSQLIDTTKEALGSGWATTWEFILGNILQAETLWTGISNALNSVIDSLSNARNDFFQAWNEGRDGTKETSGWWAMYEALSALAGLIGDIVQPIIDAFKSVFGIFRYYEDDVDEAGNKTKRLVSSFRDLGLMAADATLQFRDFAVNLRKSFQESHTGQLIVKALRLAFTALFTVVKIGGMAIVGVLMLIGNAISILYTVASHVIEFFMTGVHAVVSFFESLDFQGLLQPIIDFFSNTLQFESVAKLFQDIADGIHSIFDFARGSEEGFDNVQAFFNTISGDFSGILGAVAEKAHELAKGLGEIAAIGAGGVFQGLTWAFEQLQKIGSKLQPVFDGIKTVAVSVWDSIVTAFTNSNFSFDPFINMFSGFKDSFKSFVEDIVDNGFSFDRLMVLFEELKGSVKGFIEVITGAGGPIDSIRGIVDRVASSFDKLSEIKIPLLQEGGSLSQVPSSLGKVHDAFKAVESVVKALMDPIGTISSFLSGSLNGILKGINDFVTQIDSNELGVFIDRLMQMASMAAVVAGLYEFLNFVKSASGLINSIKAVPEAIAGLASGLTNAVKTFEKGLKIQMVKEIGVAIALLVASLFVLTLIDYEKLQQVFPYLLGIMASMLVVTGIMSKLGGAEGFNVTALAAFSASMMAIAGAITGLAVVMTLIGLLPDGVIQKGLLTIVGIAAIMSALMIVMSVTSKVAKTSGLVAFGKLAATMTALLVIIGIVGMLPPDAMLRGVVALSILTILIGGLAMVLAKVESIKFEIAVSGMLGFAAAMAVLAGAIAILSLFDSGKVMLSAVALGLLMAAMGVFVMFISDTNPAGFTAAAGGILALAAAMAILAAAIAGLTVVSNLGDLGAATLALGALIVFMGAAIAIAGAAGPGLAAASAAIVSFAVAVGVLAAVLVVFTAIDANALWTAIGQIAVSLLVLVTAFGLVAVIATICAAGIAAISGFVMALGTAAMLIGISALAIAAALAIMAVSGPDAARAFIESVKIIGQGLFEAIPQIMLGVAGIITGIVGGILMAIPALIAAALAVVGALVGVLVMAGPILGAGAVLMVAGLIDGFATGLETYGPKITEALAHLGKVVVEGILNILSDGINEFNDWLYDVTNGLMGVDTDAVRAQGQGTAEAYGQGLEEGTPAVTDPLDAINAKASETFGGLGTMGEAGVSDMLGGMLEAAQANGISADQIFGMLPEEVRSQFSGMSDVSYEGMYDVVSKMNQGAEDANSGGNPFEKMINFGTDTLRESRGNFQAAGSDLISSLNQGVQDGMASQNPANTIAENTDSGAISGIIAQVGSEAGAAGGEAFNASFDIDPKPKLNEAANAINAAKSTIGSAAQGAGQAATSGFSNGLGNITGIISSRFSGASSAISSQAYAMKNAAYYSGSMAGQGLVEGLNSKMSQVSNAAQNLMNSALNALNRTGIIRSPSRKTMETGRYLAEGLAIGMLDNVNVAENAASSLGTQAISVMMSQVAMLTDLMDEIDAEPTITPVLDLSNVEYGVSRLSGLMPNSSQAYNLRSIGGYFGSSGVSGMGANSVVDNSVTVIIDDATINSTPEIQAATRDYLMTLNRYAEMNHG